MNRETFIPQTEQVPCEAFLPFFKVTWAGLRISLWVLHLRQ